MRSVTEKLLTEVLEMPQKDRAFLAQQLILSLDPQVDAEMEIAWQAEIQQRLAEIETGKVACLPWEEVRRKLRGNEHDSN